MENFKYLLKTGRSQKVVDETRRSSREIIKKIPLDRIAEVSDVATAVAFLASDASSMITGTSILIDGGWTAI